MPSVARADWFRARAVAGEEPANPESRESRAAGLALPRLKSEWIEGPQSDDDADEMSRRSHVATEARDELLLRAVETLGAPLAVVDRRGTVVLATESFRRELAEREGDAEEPFPPLDRLKERFNGRLEVRDITDAEGERIGHLILLGTDAASGAGEVLEEVASHVAHELRNPLGTISGFATLLQREFDPEDRRTKWVRKIIDAVARLDRMVTQLHLYVQQVQSHPRPVDLVEATREIFSFAEVKFGAHDAGVRFEYRFPEEPVYVLLDPHWWQEVVLILCSNAVQALADGGEVSVRIERGDEVAHVSVVDNGGGIPDEMRGKLFYPFFSSKPDGTGLGLAVARKLIRSMGGSIEVSSVPTGGTQVTISFQAV